MINEDKVVNYPNSLETRVALLEASISNINQTLIRLENKMDKGFDYVHRRFDDVDHNLNRFEAKMDKQFTDARNEFKDVRKDMKTDFRWLLAIIGGLGLVMAHGFHWF